MRIARQMQDREQHQHERRADETELLPHHREDEVGVLLGDEVQVRLRRRGGIPRPKSPPDPIAISDCCRL